VLEIRFALNVQKFKDKVNATGVGIQKTVTPTQPKWYPIPDSLIVQGCQKDDPQATLIDLDHLAGQTMYDNALQNEVLALFHQQLLTARSQIEAMNAEKRRDLAHCLVGAARAVGAFPLARILAELSVDPSSKLIVERILKQTDSLIPHLVELMKPRGVAKG